MTTARQVLAGLAPVALLTARLEIGPALAVTMLGVLAVTAGIAMWCWSDRHRTRRMLRTIRTLQSRRRRQRR